ncbi:MAG: universal stress protein, partial [Euryarchaeota archaeon]|nr:universal stress protein [Euryarchaeota archaeon]
PDFRRIVVGVDGTGSASMALTWAQQIAAATDAKVFAVMVLGPAATGLFARSPRRGELREREERIGRDVLEKSVGGLEKAGVDVTGILARGFPAFEILRVADHKRADLIILGSHGHSGRDRVLIGSVADSVKNNAATSVLIAKAPFGPGPVLVPVDGSADSRAAAVVGLRLARRWDAETQVYHVFEPPVFYDPDDARDQFRGILDDIDVPRAPSGVRYLLELGHPRRRMTEFIAQNKPRLVVMGARGRSKLRTLVAGSTANHVVHESAAAVLLVRRRR